MRKRSSLVYEETFAFFMEVELRKAMRLHYPVSLLTVLLDPEGGGEIPDPRRLGEQTTRVIAPVIRDTDMIRLPAASPTLQVLLVNADLDDLPDVILRILAEVRPHLFQIDGDQKALVLSVGGACFPATAATAENLIDQAGTLAREAREAGSGRSNYRIPGTPNGVDRENPISR